MQKIMNVSQLPKFNIFKNITVTKLKKMRFLMYIFYKTTIFPHLAHIHDYLHIFPQQVSGV